MANIYGTDNNNWLTGTSAADYMKGFGGDDTLKGGGGADQLYGGTGIDTAIYSDSATGVTVDLMLGRGTRGSAQGDTLFSIENVSGSEYGDLLIGNGGANVLSGLSDSDRLIGGGGGDILDGGYNSDVLEGGAGADTLIGGHGIDAADYLLSPGGVYVSLIDNFGLYNDAHGDVFSGVEDVWGSISFGDSLIGDNGANNLSGIGGADQLWGLGGDDRLDGGEGADVMVGGFGNDTYIVYDAGDVVLESGSEGIDTVLVTTSYVLTAGADVENFLAWSYAGTDPIDLTGNASGNDITGNDGVNVINGGDGRDSLTGRGGGDVFLFNTPLSEAVNIDRITDYNVLDDTIWLDDAIFSSLGLGIISAGAFVTGTAAQDASDRIIYNSNTGALSYDSDGNGGIAQVQFATLNAGLALEYLDFYVV
jgi:Ca2+-binding RTX toxin-like protein